MLKLFTRRSRLKLAHEKLDSADKRLMDAIWRRDTRAIGEAREAKLRATTHLLSLETRMPNPLARKEGYGG